MYFHLNNFFHINFMQAFLKQTMHYKAVNLMQIAAYYSLLKMITETFYLVELYLYLIIVKSKISLFFHLHLSFLLLRSKATFIFNIERASK